MFDAACRALACLLFPVAVLGCGEVEEENSSTGMETSSDTSETSSGTSETLESSSGESTGELPGELLDLSLWKLTLPTQAPDDDGPLEVRQPELATFVDAPYFEVLGGTRVRFRAHVGGATTSGSGYPRSELREMTPGGQEKASWSTSEGSHTMTITQAITHIPEVKPHVVAGQIHDDGDDIVMIRLEGARLFVEADGDELGDLDSDYTLGSEFTVRIHAEDGVVDIYYNNLDAPVVSYSIDAKGCYFKAGVYTQSNPDKGDSPDDYGEVEMFDLLVEHVD
ncbi:MAG: polysaccharide lyase family 7 protein [Nannocystaceae bacterium]